jgi:signal transduction histidine kinase
VVVAVDPSEGWSALSDAFATVLGYDRQASPDCRLMDLVHPEDRPSAVALFLACCAGQEPEGALDLRICTADAGCRTLEVTARTFVDTPEVGVVVFYGLDVTAQRETERTVRLEQHRLSKLVETMADGILLLDAEGRICLTNRAAHRLLRVGGFEQTSDPVFDWRALVAVLEGRLAQRGSLDRLLGTIEHALVGEEVVLADGRVLELNLVPLCEEGEPTSGMLVHLRDVTARTTVRRGLEERSRGLEERNRALLEATALNNEFVATVSHELRGPLSSVVAFAHLLGDATTGELSEDQRTYLDVIDRNANRLLRLIEDLLMLSRLEARTLQLKPMPTRLPELLAVAVAERTPAAVESGIELTLDCVDGPEIICDDTRIHQVVDNLVSNALKFTVAGGRVAVRARVALDGWTVEVADSGVGIPAGDLPRLFSAFYRGSNVVAVIGRQVMPGTGLGLVVSRAIVELHGGTINVASTEGVGTTVTLSLPSRPARSGG